MIPLGYSTTIRQHPKKTRLNQNFTRNHKTNNNETVVVPLLDVIFSELIKLIIVNEFDSHWVTHNFGLGPNLVLWEPYPSYHNGLFSPLLALEISLLEADQYRCYPNCTILFTFSM